MIPLLRMLDGPIAGVRMIILCMTISCHRVSQLDFGGISKLTCATPKSTGSQKCEGSHYETDQCNRGAESPVKNRQHSGVVRIIKNGRGMLR